MKNKGRVGHDVMLKHFLDAQLQLPVAQPTPAKKTDHKSLSDIAALGDERLQIEREAQIERDLKS